MIYQVEQKIIQFNWVVYHLKNRHSTIIITRKEINSILQLVNGVQRQRRLLHIISDGMKQALGIYLLIWTKNQIIMMQSIQQHTLKNLMRLNMPVICLGMTIFKGAMIYGHTLEICIMDIITIEIYSMSIPMGRVAHGVTNLLVRIQVWNFKWIPNGPLEMQ